jgi:hypothetical protein
MKGQPKGVLPVSTPLIILINGQEVPGEYWNLLSAGPEVVVEFEENNGLFG